MKKVVFALAVCLLPSVASAKIEFKNLEEDVKLKEFCTWAGNSAAAPVQGTRGAIANLALYDSGAVAAPAALQGTSTAPSTFSRPSKLIVDLLDGGASTSNALTCSSVTIVGQGQFGEAISETVASVTETPQTTTNVFSVVTSVTGAGCAEGADAGDVLLVFQSNVVGLQVKIGAKSDVESVCASQVSQTVDTSGASAVVSIQGDVDCARFNNGGTDDIESAVNLKEHTINLDALEIDAEGGNDDGAIEDRFVCIRVRSSKRSRW